MVALGVPNLPSDRTMDDIDKELQKICGIQTHRYEGKLGHVYYVNDLAGIIAQEFSNVHVRAHLNFLPEDAGKSLSEAYQADRWLKEQDPKLLTPVHLAAGQDFFTLEPALLADGKTVCMPSRWFRRHGKVFAKAWAMTVVELENDRLGWAVQTHQEIEISESDLLLSFPRLERAHETFSLIRPSLIIGMLLFPYPERAEETAPNVYHSWTKTAPSLGNRWRTKSHGKRVVAFPIWLYCDDTSGNVSKKWNKHNSFLFTPAGLPRHLASQETNIHFLCTSNTAPPLEMLDGIVEQLSKAQSDGIWAWDSHLNDLVLVIPSVHALLGDNPMQSEFACHIGFRGLLFCRNCKVSGKVENNDNNSSDHDGNASDASIGSASSQTGKKRTKTPPESMKDMIARITNFMKRGTPRTSQETQAELRSQFVEASRVGGGAEFQRMKTKAGIKDTYQGVFVERLQAIATKKGLSKDEREREMIKLKLSFPEHTTSPVWRICGLDPHQDTPVEVLHVILLGAVKYFWRDTVNRTNNKTDRPILIARLSSFNTWGLGIPPLNGNTLVNYAGSLTGRDFRAIAQAAPFILEGLISNHQLEVWKALSTLVTLVWQPKIHDIDQYLQELEQTIDHFLDCTCRLTPRWFNKPKFHVLLHLPAHIRRFGPAMLFATESFESFNAVIRARSVHSNRQAPSKDIAHAMARGNRVRHLLNGGLFWTKTLPDEMCADPSSSEFSAACPRNATTKTLYEKLSDNPLQFTESIFWRSASEQARALLRILNFDVKLLAPSRYESACSYCGSNLHTSSLTSVFLQSGDQAFTNHWIVWNRSTGGTTSIPTIGMIMEVLQFVGSNDEHKGMASLVTVHRAITGEWHPHYGMRQIELTTEYLLVRLQDILCVVNVQHNCCDNKCPVKRVATVMKEREDSQVKELRVEHINGGSLILNAAQMRSSAYLKPFRKGINPLNRDMIINESVRAEIDARKQKAKAASKEQGATANQRQSRMPSSLRQNSIPADTTQPHQQSSMHPTSYQVPFQSSLPILPLVPSSHIIEPHYTRDFNMDRGFYCSESGLQSHSILDVQSSIQMTSNHQNLIPSIHPSRIPEQHYYSHPYLRNGHPSSEPGFQTHRNAHIESIGEHSHTPHTPATSMPVYPPARQSTQSQHYSYADLDRQY
ncbi:hypothetical protein F5051DRAFT_462159 [Lentinula edodes]|nr:hypothetical protein F5051DRAFT_462159 [Lentinula edodes]